MVDQIEAIEIPSDEIDRFCRKWGVCELSLFGSVLGQDFSLDSDIDVLVTFESDSKHGLFDMVRMQDELEGIFGRNVDLVSRRGVESSTNHIRRRNILDSAMVIYAA